MKVRTTSKKISIYEGLSHKMPSGKEIPNENKIVNFIFQLA